MLYKNTYSSIKELVSAILESGEINFLFLVDNCPIYDLHPYLTDCRILYIKNVKNIGFGAAHNIAIKDALKRDSTYHFIINPDITLNPRSIHDLIESMNMNPDIGLMMPSIFNPNGSVQHLPKLLPSPFSIVARKINSFFPFFQKFVSNYEMRNLPNSGLYNVPIVSGCFSVISRVAIENIGLFDEKYFIYFEDWDLSRRVSSRYRTALNASIFVIHEYNSGANRSLKLLFYFLHSAFTYFNKWGFFNDRDRDFLNSRALSQIKQ